MLHYNHTSQLHQQNTSAKQPSFALFTLVCTVCCESITYKIPFVMITCCTFIPFIKHILIFTSLPGPRPVLPPSLPPLPPSTLQHSSDSSPPLIPTIDSVANPDWDRSGTPTITLRLHPDRMETMSLKSALCGGGFSCFSACACGRWGWMGACVNKPICPSKC